MKKDRFQGYNAEVKHLVQEYEASQERHRYFDPDEMATIIDFYLDAIDDKMRSGNMHVNTHQLEHAILYAEELFPDEPLIRLRKAHLYSIQGRYEAALKILHDLERLEPDNTDVQYALGTLYSALDQPRQALHCYQKASADGYQLGTIYGNMGDEYYRMGRLEDAIRYYKKAVAHNADEERALMNLDSTYDELNMNEEAVGFLQHFVRRNPYSLVGWYCLGRSNMGLAEQQNDPSYYRKAIESFRLALSIDSRYFDAYVLIAECQQELGENGEAIATLRESLNYAKDSTNVLFTIAAIYMRLHNYTTAAIYLKQATDQDPYFSEAWLRLARCNDAMGYLDDADELYRIALGMNEHNDEFWLYYATFLIDKERYTDAVALLERGITTADYPHNFTQKLILCYHHTGEKYKLYNLLIESLQNGTSPEELLSACPELSNDPYVLDLITHH